MTVGQRVRQVRELLGWSQTELAQRAGMGQGRVSELEADRSAGQDTVTKVANATGFPASWFSRPFEAEFPEGTIRYRKTSRASRRDDRRALRRLEIAVEIVGQLGEGRRLPVLALHPLAEAGSDPRGIETAARQTREMLGVGSRGPIQHLVRLAERAGAVVVPLPFDLGPVGSVSHHHGVSAWPAMIDRPVIGFSTADPGDRERHTIGHELGHLVLHRSAAEPGRDYEREASQFAGALLMPLTDARAAFAGGVTLSRLAELKSLWGISIAGLIVRAFQVGTIDRMRYESLFKQLSARGWRKAEPVTVHREEPALIPRLIEAAFGSATNLVEAARALSLPPHLLRELATAGRADQPPAGDREVEVHSFRSGSTPN